jgi:hypothetical protein
MERLFIQFDYDETRDKMYEAIKERLLYEVTYSSISIDQ